MPKGNKVLVKVHATTVNRTDCANPHRQTIYHEGSSRAVQTRKIIWALISQAR